MQFTERIAENIVSTLEIHLDYYLSERFEV